MTAKATSATTDAAPKPQSDALKHANEARAQAARDRAEARNAAEAEAAANAPEPVDGFHAIQYEGTHRYVSDVDGYQTAYAHEAKAHNARLGRG